MSLLFLLPAKTVSLSFTFKPGLTENIIEYDLAEQTYFSEWDMLWLVEIFWSVWDCKHKEKSWKNTMVQAGHRVLQGEELQELVLTAHTSSQNTHQCQSWVRVVIPRASFLTLLTMMMGLAKGRLCPLPESSVLEPLLSLLRWGACMTSVNHRF